MTVSKVQAVARKEFYHLLRDFRSLYLAFCIPILLILLFGYALSLDVENIRVVVVDHDKTSLTRDLLRKMNASSYFNITRHLPNVKKAIEYLDQGWTMMAVIIPPDWTEDIRADRNAQVQVLIDGSDPNYATLTRAYTMGFISQYNQHRLRDFLNRKGAEGIDPPVERQIRVWFNEDLESTNFIVPGIIAIIIMLVGALLTSLVIAREYENGTMETLRTLPLGAEEFLLGKAVPYFFIGLIDILVAVLLGQILFGVVVKASFWLMVLASSMYLLVALSLGLFISVATKSQLVANQAAVLISYLPALMLSDFVFPVTNMPKIFQVLTKIVPATYFIDILNGLYLRNLGFAHLWSSYGILGVMFICLSLVSLRKLRKGEM